MISLKLGEERFKRRGKIVGLLNEFKKGKIFNKYKRDFVIFL